MDSCPEPYALTKLLSYIVPLCIIILQAFVNLLMVRHWSSLKRLCACRTCDPKRHTTIFSVLQVYKKKKLEREMNRGPEMHSHLTVESLHANKESKMFFSCWQLLFENTFLEECKDSPARVRMGEWYNKMSMMLKKGLQNGLIFAMIHVTRYVLPLQIIAFQIRWDYGNHTIVNIIMTILIVLLGFLRLFTQIFIVSLMSSRRELLRVGLDTFQDVKWVRDLIKYHYIRSLYLTTLFETFKLIGYFALVGTTSDFLDVAKAGWRQFNLVITALYMLRSFLFFSVMDIGRSSKRAVVQNDDLVYKEQKKLWYILNFLPRYLPDVEEISRISKQNSDDFEEVENKLRQKFKGAYELFANEIEVMKRMKCQSINTSHMGKNTPFNAAILYFIISCVGSFLVYITILAKIDVQYNGSFCNDILYLIFGGLLFLQMMAFPAICIRIWKIDVLFDDRATEGLLNELTIKRKARPKASDDNIMYTDIPSMIREPSENTADQI